MYFINKKVNGNESTAFVDNIFACTDTINRIYHWIGREEVMSSDMINHSPLSIQPISNIWGWMNKLSILDFQLLAINQNTVQINSPSLLVSRRQRQTLNISHNRYLPNMTSNEPPSTFSSSRLVNIGLLIILYLSLSISPGQFVFVTDYKTHYSQALGQCGGSDHQIKSVCCQ